MRIRDLFFRVRTLLGLSKAERELDEELAFHTHMEQQKLERAGMTPADAASRVERDLGGVAREKQRARDQWGINLARDLASDVRHAFRQFRRRPAFTLAGTLTLAIGIGATVSLFSVVRGTLLRPLPVERESELHVLWQDYNWRGAEYDFLRDRAPAFSDLAAYSINGYTLTVGDGAITALAGVVSANVFDLLGAAPLKGRTFATGDDRAGAEPRLVLGYRLWQRAFGGDTGIVGKRVTVDGTQVTVIGVMPKSFYFPTPEIDLWRPLNLDHKDPQYANNGWLVLIGRTKPNATPADVQRGVQSMAAELGKQWTYPAAWDKTRNAHTTLLREYLQGSVRPALLLLLGAVVVLLLMACANVAALVLSRTADRAPEMALRTALGAGGGRLARQIIAESLALSVVSGVLGAALATATFGILVQRAPLRDGLQTTLGVDWSMFLVALGIAAIVGLFVAAAPVRAVLVGKLKGISGDRSAGASRTGHHRFHPAMVAVEMTLGVTLAAGALLLVRSVSHLYAQDTGFKSAGVVTLDVLVPRDMTPEARTQYYADLERRASALPNIESVGYVTRLPVRDGGWQGLVQSKSRPDIANASAPNSYFRFVSPDYLKTMGIGIVRGRGFTDADRANAPPVAVVSESFANRMWPGQNAVGQFIAFGFGPNPNWIEVVGVAKESRLYRMVGDNPMGMFIPLAQSGAQNSLVLVAKTNANKTAAMAALRDAVRQTDRRAAVGRVISMDDVVATSLSDQLRLRFFLSTFAALALVLGAIGVYGVVSYAVARRQAEFGVRLALGATSGRVLREVATGGLRPVALGVVGGIVASVLLSRFATKFLFGVSPHDVLSIGGAAVALLAAGVVAVIVPGVRAGRTSPMQVLRGE